jgi:trigger factor
MQVTQTLSEGLKRQFTVTLPAKDLEERLTSELAELKDKVRINGFRPGKVPVQHLRRVYGKSVMSDVLQNLVNEANRRIVEDNALKLAFEPKIEFPEDKAQVEAALEARGDLSYTVSLEVLPSFELQPFAGLSVVRETVEVPEADVATQIERMAAQSRTYTSKEGDAPVGESGDRLVVDFVGTINGEAFEGGTGTDISVDLGSGTFIPGFEDQLAGATKGETRTVNVTFPPNYGAAALAGQAASFEVTVKDVQAPGALTIDDELAKSFGFDTLDALREAVKESIGREFAAVSRRKLKRQLLDALDSQYTFELPPSLLSQEFENIWRQVQADMQQSGKGFADEGTTEDEARAEYQKIAERRVRLGLVLAEIGEAGNVQVSEDEMSNAIIERARQFPGQEKMVWEFYRKNPQALAEVRAPLFEDKVVDHILATATVTEKSVSKDDLLDERTDEEKAAAPKADDATAAAEAPAEPAPKKTRSRAKKATDESAS